MLSVSVAFYVRGKKTMSRYSKTLLEHARNPQNGGTLSNPTHEGKADLNGASPRIQIQLRVTLDGLINDARFSAFGCGVTIACCSVVTTKVIGQTVAEAICITEDDILTWLDGIPSDKRFCVSLARGALLDALAS